MLWETFRNLRRRCEENDGLVMVFTVDHRPEAGRHELRRSAYFTDARFRSFIGDAGRQWCHQRYRVDGGEGQNVHAVTVIKDEAEGVNGRHLWRRSR
jgi:hypothetical protein